MVKAWNQIRVFRGSGDRGPNHPGTTRRSFIAETYRRCIEFRRTRLFGAHGLEQTRLKDVIAEIRPLTAKPFAMNLWVSMEDEEAHTSDAQHSATLCRISCHTSRRSAAYNRNLHRTSQSDLKIRRARFS